MWSNRSGVDIMDSVSVAVMFLSVKVSCCSERKGPDVAADSSKSLVRLRGFGRSPRSIVSCSGEDMFGSVCGSSCAFH